MFCTECGAKLDGETVCPQCGTPVEGAEITEPAFAPEEPEMTEAAAFEPEAAAEPEIPAGPEFVPEPAPAAAAEPDPVEQARLEVRAGLAGVYGSWRYLVSAVLLLVGAVIGIGGAVAGGMKVSGAIGTILTWVLLILQLVAMFVTYADSLRKEHFTGAGLGLFAGVFQVKTILGWIGTGLFVLCALLFFLAPGLATTVINNIDLMPNAAAVNTASRSGSAPQIANWMLISIGIFFALSAIVTLLLTLFYYRGQNKMAKSVCRSLNAGEYMVTNVKGVRFWSLIQGIASIIVAICAIVTAIVLRNGLVSAIGLICSALSHLFYHSWMKKCFRTRKELRRVGEVPGL